MPRLKTRPALLLAALFAALTAIAALSAFAWTPALADDEASPAEIKKNWCDDSWSHRGRDDFYVHCEVREFTLGARKTLDIDGGLNGGVKVYGWDRNEIVVLAKVEVWSDSRAESDDLAGRIKIDTDKSTIEATGPGSARGWRRDEPSWGVSYRVFVPRHTDLSLRTHNGGIGIEGVTGRMNLEAMNGGLALSEVGGDVYGRTTNGSLAVDLDGARWDGEGLDLRTTNGSVNLRIPDAYNADLETGTTNGRLNIDFPVTVRGEVGKRIHTEIGKGGPMIRAITTNGAVRIRREG